MTTLQAISGVGYPDVASMDILGNIIPFIDGEEEAVAQFAGRPQQHRLPSAPARPVVYLDQANRPQPQLDVERENGMAMFIGRLRPCPVLDYKFVALRHNTVRGAAGAAVLNAELMAAEGLLD